LHDRFGHQERWSIFNRQISQVTGAWTSTLVQLGLLDTVDET
jgi:dTDP-D-glucose 4,6-dehydratase